MALLYAGAAFAQSPDETYSYGGQTVTYSQSENDSTITYSDDKNISPDKVLFSSINGTGSLTTTDGPRTDVEDIIITEWSADRRFETTSNSLGQETVRSLNDQGQLISIVDTNGNRTSFQYENHQIISMVKGAGTSLSQHTQISYGDDGAIASITLPSGRILSGERDANGNYSQAIRNVLEDISGVQNYNPVSNLVKTYYNSDKQRLARLIANEYLGSSRVYDDTGRLTSAQNLEGGVVTFAYDEFDNLTEVVDPRGVVTRYTHDGFGQLVEEVSPERGTTRYQYDEAGNLIRETREGGLIIKRQYDALNRITREVFKQKGVDRKVNRFVYDNCDNGIGRLCRVNSDGHITRYDYNVLGQMTKIATKTVDSDSFETVRYDYGQAGRLETIHYPTDLNVRYRYGDDGDVNRVLGWYGEGESQNKFVIARNIQTDPNTRRLSSLTFGNGIKSNYGYSEQGLTSKIALRKDGNLLDRRDYSYDDNFNVTAIARPDAALTQSFSYDSLSRLTGEQRGAGAVEASTLSYSYDASGNRTSRSDGNQTRTYDYQASSNQLQSINGKTSAFDERRNLVLDRRGKRQFTYDVTNRMTGFYKNDELQARYSYNAFGQRVNKTTMRPMTAADDHKSLNFAYTPQGQLLSEIGRKSDNSKSFTHEYVWLGGMPLAKLSRKIKEDGTTRKAKVTYLHTDHLATPRRATNEAGKTVWTWESDAFGAGGVNKDPDGDGKNTNVRLRFPGQYFDRESGLFYNNQRDYDPKLGRYVQSDPIGLWDGTNRYNYVKASPLNAVDPTGLLAVPTECEDGDETTGCGTKLPGTTPSGPIGGDQPGDFDDGCGPNPCPQPPGEGGPGTTREAGIFDNKLDDLCETLSGLAENLDGVFEEAAQLGVARGTVQIIRNSNPWKSLVFGGTYGTGPGGRGDFGVSVHPDNTYYVFFTIGGGGVVGGEAHVNFNLSSSPPGGFGLSTGVNLGSARFGSGFDISAGGDSLETSWRGGLSLGGSIAFTLDYTAAKNCGKF